MRPQGVRGRRHAGSWPLGGLLDVGRIFVENNTQANTYRDCMTNLGYERKEG